MGNICSCSAEPFRFKSFVVDIYPVKKRGKTVDGPRIDRIGQMKSYIKTNPQRIPRVCRKIKKLIVRDLNDYDVKGVSIGFFILKEIISDCQTATELDYYTAHCVDIVSLVLRHASDLNRVRSYTDYKGLEADAVIELQLEACDTIAMLTFQLAKTSGARLRPLTKESTGDNVLIVGLKSAFVSSGGTAMRQLADTKETVFRPLICILANSLGSSDIIQINYRYAAYVVISNYIACLQIRLSTVVEEITPIILANFMSSLAPLSQEKVRVERSSRRPVIGGKYSSTIEHFDILSRISLRNTVLLSVEAKEKDSSFIEVSAGALFHLTLCPNNSEIKKYCSYITDFCLRNQSWRNHHFIEEVFKLITYALEFGRGSRQEGTCGGYLLCQHLCDEVSARLLQVGDTVSLCGVLIAVQTVLSTMSYKGQSSNSGAKSARRIAFNLIKQLILDQATYSEIIWSRNVSDHLTSNLNTTTQSEESRYLSHNAFAKRLGTNVPANCGIVCLFDVLVGIMAIIVNEPAMDDLGAGAADTVQFATEMIGAARTASTRQILCGCLELLAILAPLVRRNNADAGRTVNAKHQRIDLLVFVLPLVPRLDDEVWDSAMNVVLGYLRLDSEETKQVDRMEDNRSNNSLELKAARLLHVIENKSPISSLSDDSTVLTKGSVKRSDGSYLLGLPYGMRPPLIPQSTQAIPLAEEDDELIIVILTRLLLLNGDSPKDILTASGKLAASLLIVKDIEKNHTPHTLQIVGNIAAAYSQLKGSESTTLILSIVFGIQEMVSNDATHCTALAQCLGHISISILHTYSNVIGNENLTKYCIDVFSKRYVTTNQGEEFGPWFTPRVAAEIIPLETGFEAERDYEELQLFEVPAGKIHSLLSISTVLTYLGVTDDVLRMLMKTHALLQHSKTDAGPLTTFSAAAKALISNPYLMLTFAFFIDLNLHSCTEYRDTSPINGGSLEAVIVSSPIIDDIARSPSSPQLSDPTVEGSDERNHGHSFLNIMKMLFRSPKNLNENRETGKPVSVASKIEQGPLDSTTLALQKRLSFIGNYPCLFFDRLRNQLRALHRTGTLEASNIHHGCSLSSIQQSRRISSLLECTMDYYDSPLSLACDHAPSIDCLTVRLSSGGVSLKESREQALRSAGISVRHDSVCSDEEYSENESVLCSNKNVLMNIHFKSISLYSPYTAGIDYYTAQTKIPIPLVTYTRPDQEINTSQIFRIRTDSRELMEPSQRWKHRKSKFALI